MKPSTFICEGRKVVCCVYLDQNKSTPSSLLATVYQNHLRQCSPMLTVEVKSLHTLMKLQVFRKSALAVIFP